MRRTLLILLALTACSGGDAASRTASSSASNGPDAILVRVPRDGGAAKAYRLGRDSALWTSTQSVPPMRRVLGFDDEQGVIAYLDDKGSASRLDLRLAVATPAATGTLTGVTSADGWAVYGLTANGQVSRTTPSGSWTYAPTPAARLLIPQPDGSLVLVHDDGGRSRLRRLRPPEPRITDTSSVPHPELVMRTDIGDRIYFTGDSGLVSIRVRDFVRTKTIALPQRATALVATPSGDRVFVALEGKKQFAIVDRFADKVDRTVDLPDVATALRIDSDGQYLLIKAASSDSTFVFAIGTGRLIGTLRTEWREDLPLIGPDGGIVIVRDSDVVIVDAESRRERVRFQGGASDRWTLVRWNGFRPRAAGLDSPVKFYDDSTDDPAAGPPAAGPPAAPADSARIAPRAPEPPQAAKAVPPVVKPVPPVASAPAKAPAIVGRWAVAFASLLSEDRAKAMAQSIKVDGKPTQVVALTTNGTTAWRIVYGSYESKDAADKAGKRTGLPYWVFETTP
ncbi:MAG: SPOR domain-containing protein [Gemmatimonadetes bacterium]|nr:SPOR domain-containing protein [Gemmatimonadota bacterium]